MAEFEEYQKMKTEISNELSLSFHQLLMDNLNATQNARKENKESEIRLTKKIEDVKKDVKELQPILNAWNNGKKLGAVGEWIAQRGYKVFLFFGSIGLGWIAIKDSGIYSYIKHLFWR